MNRNIARVPIPEERLRDLMEGGSIDMVNVPTGHDVQIPMRDLDILHMEYDTARRVLWLVVAHEALPEYAPAQTMLELEPKYTLPSQLRTGPRLV